MYVVTHVSMYVCNYKCLQNYTIKGTHLKYGYVLHSKLAAGSGVQKGILRVVNIKYEYIKKKKNTHNIKIFNKNRLWPKSSQINVFLTSIFFKSNYK